MKKKALLVNTLYYPNIGGVENSLRSIANELIDEGYEVDIVCSDLFQGSGARLPRFERIYAANVYRYRYEPGIIGYFKQFLSGPRLIKSLSKNNSYDFILSRSHLSLLFCFIAGLRKIPYLIPGVVFYQDRSRAISDFPFSVINYIINCSLQTVLLIISSRNFVFSSSMHDQVNRVSLMLAKPKLVFPGVDLRRFYPSDVEKDNIRVEMGLPRDAKLLLCLGRLTEVKRFDVCIKALNYLSEEYILMVVGDGPEKDRLVSLSQQYGVSDKVIFYSATSNPELFYRACDRFLMSSSYEPFGQTILESVASGLKVVAFSKASGVKTAVDEIFNNYPALVEYSEEFNHLSFSEAVVKSFQKVDLELELSDRNAFLEKYSWKSLITSISSRNRK